MAKKPRIGLGRDWILLWTAVFGLLEVVGEIVIKVVSYARCHSQLQLHLPAKG